MKDVLEEIVAWKRIEVEEQKQQVSPRQLYSQVAELLSKASDKRSMRESLAQSASGIIAEFKRKSPSKGWIHPDILPMDVVPHYARHGASAVSILTDEKYFGGKMEFVKSVRPVVDIPLLRKEFIIDEYQLFQARQIGADAVLLIAACLKLNECKDLISKAHDLGLEVLLELHNESELDYAGLDADMVGINNRDLGTFHTDVAHSFAMADRLPSDKLWVSESGISKPETVRTLREAGFRGFLMGEHFMRHNNPGEALQQFISEL